MIVLVCTEPGTATEDTISQPVSTRITLPKSCLQVIIEQALLHQ
jgi:hypothetical protein